MAAENVLQHPAGRMTVSDYNQERAALRATYGETAAERSAIYDQALVRLFLRSGWTQEQLAVVEKRSPQWVAQQLRFGRFVEFSTAVEIPKSGLIPLQSLSEGRFRRYWGRTDPKEGNERKRFLAVVELMSDETTLSRPHVIKRPIGRANKQTSADGTWHRLATITAKVQEAQPTATSADVEAVLKGMVAHGWYDVFAEKQKGGQTYRVVNGGRRKIDLVVLMQELGPIIEGLKTEGQKNMARMSPGTVARLTCQLERLLAKLTHQPASHEAEE